jgi:hypothetical protein
MAQTNGSDFVFHAANAHVPECGIPPCTRNDNPQQYYGYFENKYGEQWVFTFDREKERGTLQGGDTGWDDTFEVIEGSVSNLILGADERDWLRTCWKAATHR